MMQAPPPAAWPRPDLRPPPLRRGPPAEAAGARPSGPSALRAAAAARRGAKRCSARSPGWALGGRHRSVAAAPAAAGERNSGDRVQQAPRGPSARRPRAANTAAPRAAPGSRGAPAALVRARHRHGPSARGVSQHAQPQRPRPQEPSAGQPLPAGARLRSPTAWCPWTGTPPQTGHTWTARGARATRRRPEPTATARSTCPQNARSC
mmetsp:Transcript_26249/g.82569  ORF Transcript_26249/g.82569 Transcript_26249/m.82569 type:complete len:207 (-) Transcript_26249:124-744(-)